MPDAKNFLFLLHGFLGRPHDWNFLETSEIKDKFELIKLDYSNTPNLQPMNSDMTTWGLQFVKEYESILNQPKKKYLIGYSLGGRLALQAFIRNPDQFEKLILISSGLGRFTSVFAESFEERLKNDKRWSSRFLNDDWVRVLSDWNSQPIFLNSNEPSRYEADYNKQVLASSLVKWSQAFMKTEDQLFEKYKDRIILVSGELDIKYSSMYRIVSRDFSISHYNLKDGGHRLIFSHQQQIKNLILSLLS